MGKIVGVDLGTTFSAIAIRVGSETKVIANSEGSNTTPSVVAFDDNGRTVGRAAKGQAATNPTRTIASAKRFIGRTHNEVSDEEKLVHYKIVGEQHELVQIDIDGKHYHVPEISAMILQDLKRSAEAYLGEKVTGAVITVPAYFNNAQRQATKEAGQIAGFDVKAIINEPTAAALAYGLDKKTNEKIFIADIGGGTSDCTCLHVCDGVFEVLSTAGDGHLGGDDWDRILVDHVADEFQKAQGFDIRTDPMALQRLMEACEKAKCDLSSTPQATINLPYITAVGGTPKHLSTTITRAKFEAICEPLFERLRKPIMQALADSGLMAAQINEVVLVGGSTRMPKIQDICREIFGREPNKSVNPDEVVAVGAAIHGAVLGGDITDIVLLDVTSLSLGVETMGGLMTVLVPRNTTIPYSKTEVFSTASDNQPAVDIHVLQGERRLSNANRTIGRFQLSGIPLAARGTPQIEVKFDVDVNGIISVTAKDKNSGKEQKVEITHGSGLPQEEIDRMVKDAAANEAEEKVKALTIEARNSADTLVYFAEKFMRENTMTLTADTMQAVKTNIDALKVVLDKYGTKPEIDDAVANAEIALKRMQEEVHNKNQQPKAAANPAPVAPRAPMATGIPEGDAF